MGPLSVTFVLTKVILNVNFTKYFSIIMQDRHYETLQIQNLILLLLVLRLKDHFRFIMLFLNKYLNINRIKFFDMSTLKK